MRKLTFYQVLSAAINDLMEHGFDSQDRLNDWLKKLADAAVESLVPESVLVQSLQDMLGRVYGREVKRLKVAEQFTLHNIQPKLRAELDRRILASANLITLNRKASVQRTLQRFAGWASSIPIGGTAIEKRGEVKTTIRRGIAGLPFEERRVIVDQGCKMAATINDIVAVDGGAIAAEWRHVREGGGYQARPQHVKRNGKIFVIRDNWALKDGLMKPAGAEYTDEIEQPSQLPFCRCSYSYIFSLRDLPKQMLTAKGRQDLSE